MDDTFDIEDLSLLINQHAGAGEEQGLLERLFSSEDLSIPVRVAPQEEGEPDTSIELIDQTTSRRRTVYRFDRGRFIRYRIGVLGVGDSVQAVHDELKERISELADQLLEELNLWAMYVLGLFGGRPKEDGVTREHARHLADQLVGFRPNFLVLVNAGAVRQRFAELSEDELALLSWRINSGAMRGGQRPYTLVFVTDDPIRDAVFARYYRLCQSMNTFPAAHQFRPDEVDQLVETMRFRLKQHAQRYLKRRGSEEGA